MEKTTKTLHKEPEQVREVKGRNNHETYALKCLKDVINLSPLSEVHKTNTKLD